MRKRRGDVEYPPHPTEATHLLGATDLAAPTGTITVLEVVGPVMVLTGVDLMVRISAACVVSSVRVADSQEPLAQADRAAFRSALRANRPCRPAPQSPAMAMVEEAKSARSANERMEAIPLG